MQETAFIVKNLKRDHTQRDPACWTRPITWLQRKILAVNKNCIIYIRVSTDEQAERGYSLQHQSSECHRYAMLNGFSVLEEISDDYSGATLDRPGFSYLRQFIAQNHVDAVIIYTADRLSRNIIDFLVLRDQLEKAGIELHFVDRGRSQNNFEGLLTDGIFALIAHGERLQIISRTTNGKHNKAKSNKIVMTGIPPYGYKKQGMGRDAEYVIDPFQAEVVRSLFDWYVNGYENKGPLSLRRISDVLDELGIEPPDNRTRKRALYWHPNSIARVLTNPIYVGITYYGRVRTENGKRIRLPKEEWIPITVPHLAIISDAIFKEAEKRLIRNKELAKRNRKHAYLMAGHFRCGRCGHVMFGYSKTMSPKRVDSFYRCGGSMHKNGKCKGLKTQISMRRVDAAVWGWVTSLLGDDHNLDEGIRAMIDKAKKEWAPMQERLETVDSLLAEADAKIARLVDELSVYEGSVVRDVIHEKIRAIESERNMLTAEAERLASDLEQNEIVPDFEEQIKRSAQIIREKLSASTYEDRRIVLDALDMRVEWVYDPERGDILRISCIIPFIDDEIVLRPSQRWLL